MPFIQGTRRGYPQDVDDDLPRVRSTDSGMIKDRDHYEAFNPIHPIARATRWLAGCQRAPASAGRDVATRLNHHRPR